MTLVKSSTTRGKPIALGKDRMAAIRKVLNILGNADHQGTLQWVWEKFTDEHTSPRWQTIDQAGAAGRPNAAGAQRPDPSHDRGMGCKRRKKPPVIRPPCMATADRVSDVVRRTARIRRAAACKELSQDKKGPRVIGQSRHQIRRVAAWAIGRMVRCRSPASKPGDCRLPANDAADWRKAGRSASAALEGREHPMEGNQHPGQGGRHPRNTRTSRFANFAL